MLSRDGVEQPAWFTFSYSAIAVDEEIPGVLCVCIETTSAALERASRQESQTALLFLDRFTQTTSALASAEGVMARATELVGKQLQVDICAYADMDENQDDFSIRGDWTAPGSKSIVGRYRLADFGRAAVDNLSRGLALVINDNRVEIAPHEAATFQAIGIASTICMPLIRNGRLSALMAVHRKTPHIWSDQELALVREATERSWAFVERARSERALHESETRLRLATEFSEIGLWDVEHGHRALYWDDRVRALFGVAPGRAVSLSDFYNGLHPDDVEATTAAYVAAADPDRRALYDVEYRTVGADDGVVRWVAAKGRGLFDSQGRCVRVAGTATDITARKQAEETSQLLMREVDHRARNSLAVIQSVVRLTDAADQKALRQALHGRIDAMSRAQAALARSNWRGGTMAQLVREELSSTLTPGSRLRLSGEEVALSAEQIQPLSMILHELATNAVKYGALSSNDGAVDVRWSGSLNRWSLHWQEHGGPPIAAPTRKGFGSRLMANLARQLGAQIRFDWRGEGLSVDMVLDKAA
ncbi:sensor histidine kinase [Caulobacter endophyticus]|uniref:sensor histidine kinase n=1 Tax=Caulobacter endophyticus TaxID=2172652 RepID=UPI00240F1811|nr:HWE histidine kinase domain-containing protein [Caulobacter endophyticus]MDG2528124.1 HWE histidine kinase domain-containing protein [Caulobacter endophyticus]